MVDLVQFRQTHQVPIWVSETGENNNEWMAANIDAMEAARRGLVPLDVEASRCLSERGPQSDWWELPPDGASP